MGSSSDNIATGRFFDTLGLEVTRKAGHIVKELRQKQGLLQSATLLAAKMRTRADEMNNEKSKKALSRKIFLLEKENMKYEKSLAGASNKKLEPWQVKVKAIVKAQEDEVVNAFEDALPQDMLDTEAVQRMIAGFEEEF